MKRKGIALSKSLLNFLEDKSDIVLKKWKEVFWDSMGEEAKRFFTKEVDRFQNPFGYRIDETFDALIKALFGDFNWEEVDKWLDRLIQMRAVQEDQPSKALHLFLQLKGVIREEIGEEILKKFGIEEFLKLEDRINALIIRSFDHFVKYRETLYKIRYEEWKRNNFLLLKKAGIVYDVLEGMPKEKPEEKYQ
jgi:hypothetical protein